MNKMIAATISPGAVTAAPRPTPTGCGSPPSPPPAPTNTRKNVPKSSLNNRRHS